MRADDHFDTKRMAEKDPYSSNKRRRYSGISLLLPALSK
jgi:hypothetical protein